MQHRVIGITGGIASGKTTVSQYLAAKYQLPVLDADIYAREAVEKGSETLAIIVAHYGEDILLSDGTLNRVKLGEIIFNNSPEKAWLESIIHPYVRRRFQEDIVACLSDTVIAVIPLLFEAEMTDLVTEIWVIYCSESKQIERLKHRNNLSSSQAQQRLKSQWSLEDKKKRADILIENTGDLDYLYQQVDQVMLANL